MIIFEVLPKILYKPKEAYESLKGKVNWKDGLLMFFVLSMVSLFIFGGIARSTGWYIMPLDFGFGGLLNVYSAVFFVLGLIIFIVIAGLANEIALKLGGKGNFSETFGMLGYSRVLNIVQAIFSIILLIGLMLRISMITSDAMAGTPGAVPNLFGPIPIWALWLSIFFIAWAFWIQGAAVSVVHKISRVKGIFAVVLPFVLIEITAYIFGVLLR
jgi:hypothetical protein